MTLIFCVFPAVMYKNSLGILLHIHVWGHGSSACLHPREITVSLVAALLSSASCTKDGNSLIPGRFVSHWNGLYYCIAFQQFLPVIFSGPWVLLLLTAIFNYLFIIMIIYILFLLSTYMNFTKGFHCEVSTHAYTLLWSNSPLLIVFLFSPCLYYLCITNLHI
jgi:hypothetical protein